LIFHAACLKISVGWNIELFYITLKKSVFDLNTETFTQMSEYREKLNHERYKEDIYITCFDICSIQRVDMAYLFARLAEQINTLYQRVG
jgi:hypothetical protein